MRNGKILSTVIALAWVITGSAHAAEEFAIGSAVEKNNLSIVPHYLTGIEMSRMPEGTMSSTNNVHLEADVHAAKDEPHGFAEKEWIPYLRIEYSIEKVGSTFKKTGHLFPMTAGDGPHYANNVGLNGPGQYHLIYRFSPPSSNGLIRHIDKATGVPDWWQAFSLDWTFTYPATK